MPLFQKPAETPEELAASKPLEIPPEEVLTFDEDEWYRRAYRGEHVPQLTLRAVLMGTVLGFFLSFTNVYIGLKTGWAIGVALTACILSYAIWNLLRTLGLARTDMTILENNCMQSTASSAGYSTGNTVVSAVPAMLLLTVTDANPKGTQMAWPLLGLWVLFLAGLGVCLAIPMKRNMINREKLTFPSGTASAVTLQGLYSKGTEAIAKARALLAAGLFAALVPILKDLNATKTIDTATHKVVRDTLLPGQSNVFDWLPGIHAAGKTWKPSDWTIKLDHGVVLIAAGALVGVRVTAWMVAGGIALAYFIGPAALDWQWVNAAGKTLGAATKPGSAWKEIGIWCGAPVLVASGLVSFAMQYKTILRAFAGLLSKKQTKSTVAEGEQPKIDPADVEVPNLWFISGTVVSGIGVVVIAWRNFNVPLHLGVLAVLMTFVLGLVACRATGESDITPGGAMGKIMQLTYGVLVPQSSTANLMTAAITSGSAAASADLLTDLKSGYLLGANPRRQFLAQAMGIVTGTVATVMCFYILVPDATALTGRDGHDPAFPAPNAQQWKAVAEVFKFGLHNLHPMSQIAIRWGLGVGAVLALLEAFFPKHKKWIPSPTGLGLGMILPFFYPFAMLVGALLALLAKSVDKKWADRYVVPLAAGGIAGESIIGVLVAALNNFVLT